MLCQKIYFHIFPPPKFDGLSSNSSEVINPHIGNIQGLFINVQGFDKCQLRIIKNILKYLKFWEIKTTFYKKLRFGKIVKLKSIEKLQDQWPISYWSWGTIQVKAIWSLYGLYAIYWLRQRWDQYFSRISIKTHITQHHKSIFAFCIC